MELSWRVQDTLYDFLSLDVFGSLGVLDGI